MTTLFKNKWTWLVIVSIICATLLWLRPTQSAPTEAASEQTATAFIGDLSASASASGAVQAAQAADLTLQTSGIVAALPVSLGDSVAAGDLLVQLETEALQRSVEAAASAVRVAEAELVDLTTPASSEDIAAAEAALASAQAAYNSLLAGPTEAEIAASQANLDAAQANLWAASGSLNAQGETSSADILQAEINLQDAQESLQAAEEAWVREADCSEDTNGTISCVPSDSDRMETVTLEVEKARAAVELAAAQLDAAQNPDTHTLSSGQANVAAAHGRYAAALARHEALLAPPTAEELAAAEADLVSAQAELDILLAGPRTTDIARAETRLAQAKTDLAAAERDLARAQLVAPFDGVVTAIYVTQGEVASGLAIELTNMHSLEVILNVDELDIGLLALEQPAEISFETWPEVVLDSQVSAIAPQAGLGSGSVTFDVTLTFDPGELPIRLGMTANADLITAQREGVLLIPNAALNTDRSSGISSVQRLLPDGSLEQVEVTIGLRDSAYTQILSGLAEGDEVQLGRLQAPIEDNGFAPPGFG